MVSCFFISIYFQNYVVLFCLIELKAKNFRSPCILSFYQISISLGFKTDQITLLIKLYAQLSNHSLSLDFLLMVNNDT
jgi:hypothetical protein